MPQEMNVLRCYACEMYQVHIVKKSNKWMCKICGEKQSIQVVYFQGSGVDCRHQVQYLNSLKCTEDEQQGFTLPTIDMYGLDCTADENDENDDIDRCHCPKRRKLSNEKWSQYLESSNDHVCNDSPEDKENSNLSENSDFADNRRKLRSSAKQSYSFPGIPEEFREDESTKIQTFGAKSRSYPLRTRALNILNKCTEDPGSETEERDKLRRNDFTSAAASTSGKKLTGRWDEYLEVGKVESDTMCEDDFSSTTASASDNKLTSKWDRYMDVGKAERDTVRDDNFSSTTASSSGKKLTGKWDRYLKVGKVARDAVCDNDFLSTTASSSGNKLTGKWDRYLEIGMVERDIVSEDDSLSATASSSGKKFTGKWDRYLEVGKIELDMVCEDDFSSISTTCSGKKLSGKRDGYSDSETEEQYTTCENCSSSAASPFLTTTLDDFLEEAKDERESNSEVEDERDKATANNSTAARRQSTKCNIFEDYNDDLDLTIDF